jgi:hypothetical protein
MRYAAPMYFILGVASETSVGLLWLQRFLLNESSSTQSKPFCDLLDGAGSN